MSDLDVERLRSLLRIVGGTPSDPMVIAMWLANATAVKQKAFGELVDKLPALLDAAEYARKHEKCVQELQHDHDAVLLALDEKFCAVEKERDDARAQLDAVEQVCRTIVASNPRLGCFAQRLVRMIRAALTEGA